MLKGPSQDPQLDAKIRIGPCTFTSPFGDAGVAADIHPSNIHVRGGGWVGRFFTVFQHTSSVKAH